MKTTKEMIVKCKFEQENKCFALCCYAKEKCKAKDEKGNINYATVEKIKRLKEAV